MKKFVCLAIYLASGIYIYAQELNKSEINAKSRDLMTQIRTALSTLSKTTPILQGIGLVPIQQPDVQYMDKSIYQVLELTKNMHEEEIPLQPPLPNQPLPASSGNTQILYRLNKSPAGSRSILDSNGIDLFVAIEAGWPHREITKAFEIPNDPNSLKFYYYIGTSSKDDKTTTDAEKKAIEAVLDPFGAEFLAMFKPQTK